MDQVKVYLALLKKHHFWPLAILILGVGVFAWRSGAAHYDVLYQKNSAELNSAFSSVERVASTPNHPNDFFIDEVKKLNSGQTKDVMAAWQLLYQNQMQILVWPKEFEAIGKLKPDAEIRSDLRQIVMNYFHFQFPRLFSIVNLREEVKDAPAASSPAGAAEDDAPPAGAAAGGRATGGAPAEKPEPKGLVVWPESERETIVARYRWTTPPKTKQIRYAQEDCWVYEALLKIISDTNRGISDHRSAAIKQIEALNIGQAVPPPNTRLFPLPEGAVAAEEKKPSGPSGGRSSEVTDEQLDNGRYVSADGTPLASPGTDIKEFKLMPIRMRLLMDERRIPDLLVACANSSLPVEVREVQYRPGEGGSAGGSARGGPGGSPAAPAGRPGASPQNNALLSRTPFDQAVEVRGFIYIFNPPNLGDLAEEVGESTEEAADDAGEAVPEEPAADAPAGTEATPAAEGDAPAAEADASAEESPPAESPEPAESPSADAPEDETPATP